MKALVIDAYDSFVYIIYQYLLALDVDVDVIRNDKATVDSVRNSRPDFILLGPGPGHPADAGYVELINEFGGDIPILGICLGHQAIGLAFGAKVHRASHLMHGKRSSIHHDGQGCFREVVGTFQATRYHSLIVLEPHLPSSLIVTARSADDGYVMGLRHRQKPIESVQFHPESIYTDNGLQIFDNFITTYVRGEEVRSIKYMGDNHNGCRAIASAVPLEN